MVSIHWSSEMILFSVWERGVEITFIFTYCYELLQLLAILLDLSNKSSEKLFHRMPDLQRMVMLAFENLFLNSFPVSSTMFLSFWMFPWLPSTDTKWEQGNKICWVSTAIGSANVSKPVCHASHDRQVEIMTLQFIIKEYKFHRPPEHTPNLVFLAL